MTTTMLDNRSPFSRARALRRHATLVMLGSLLAFSGCDLAAGGSSNAPEPPPKPEYERSFDEFADVPHQITAQVEWAAEPIDDLIRLADEIAALRTKLNVDAETFTAMCTVAFKDGKIELGAEAEIGEAKAEIEATLARIKEVAAELQGLPDRVKVAGKSISKLAMSVPKLAMASGKELTGELSIAVGDTKVQIEADIQTVKNLPNEVKAEVAAAKDVLAGLPAKAEAATKNLFAAIKGEPYTPVETTGSGEGEATPAEADTGSGEGTMIADAGAATAEPDSTSSSTSTSTSGSTSTSTSTAPSPKVPPPPQPLGVRGTEGAAIAPPAIIASRVRHLETMAATVSKRGDWLTAADALEEAYRLAPDNPLYAFKVGDAATRAKDCARAQVYFERFLAQADPNEYPDKIQAAKKALGEFKTFDCPERSAEDEAALAKTLAEQGLSLGAEGDWGGAAFAYYEAYQHDPNEPLYAFEIGVSSWRANECSDAVDYLYHFLKKADPRRHGKQIREANKYVERAEAGECLPLSKGQRDSRARELYTQGQNRELALDYLGAVGKYERAYMLLPENHAFSFRTAEAYWGGQRCNEAEPHYRDFLSKADPARFGDDITRAQQVLGRIAAHGCPNALWNTGGAGTAGASGSSVSSTGGDGSDGGSEPPPSGGSGRTSKSGGSVYCSVTEDSAPTGALGLGLLVLAALRRRRG
jgi:MYXO-CTERM domain-containing protein